MSTNGTLFGPEHVQFDDVDRDGWCTPPAIVDRLMYFTGGEPVDLDPCSNERSIVPARKRLTREDSADGLPVLPWRGTVYCNWPFSRPLPWVQAAVSQTQRAQATWVVGCGVCDPSTIAWSYYVWQAHAICFPERRIAFLSPPGVDSSTFDRPVALPLWAGYDQSAAARDDIIARFKRAFSGLGKVVLL